MQRHFPHWLYPREKGNATERGQGSHSILLSSEQDAESCTPVCRESRDDSKEIRGLIRICGCKAGVC